MKTSLDINKYVKYITSSIQKEKYPNRYNILSFNFDIVIHYLTWRCNSRCITCYCWKTPASETANEVWNIDNIEKLYSTLRTKKVYLTGGEPTIVKNFKEIVFAIHKKTKALISFCTNGISTEKIKDDIIWLKNKNVPLDVGLSCNGFEEKHDLSRGVKGNYRKISELTEFFKKNNIKFSIVFSVFPFNLSEGYQFIKNCRERGIEVILSIGRTDDRYKLDNNVNNALLTKDDYKKIESLLIKISQLNLKYFIEYYLIKEINKGRTIFPCFGLYKRLALDPYGRVYPCDGLSESLCLGDLRNSNFDFNSFIQYNKTAVEKVFNVIRNKKCQPCMYVCDLIHGIGLTYPNKELLKAFFRKIFKNKK